MAAERIRKELTNITIDPPTNVSASLIDDNLFCWQGKIMGPINSPYEGGTFKLFIRFTDNYPNAPPFIIFQTPIYHPNISTMGTICLNILRQNWQPIFTISHVLLCICALLCEPNPDDFMNEEAAIIFKNNREEFNRLACDSTMKHAIAN